MEILRECSRREVLEFYLSREREKGTYASLEGIDINDPNVIDRHFASHGLKIGVIPGYKCWKYVKLFKKDLLECAIVNHVFPPERLLSVLSTKKEFQEWRPHRKTTWYEIIEQMEDPTTYPKKWALILRPALPSEDGAKWYIEDGSGRSICFLRRLLTLGKDGFVYAYIGIEPDQKSEWIHREMPMLFSCHS
ncbi:MAG: hypothetical protein PHX93_03445 [Candidatus Peribacteraceae bacterium]|nr:hypothetical protein [Candidatus Peribacteraceae bacterium]